MKKSTIEINISLDEKSLPENIFWQNRSEGAGQDAKAMLVSFFDKESLETLKIDLWTKDMQINEMDRFMYHSLRGLADTYFNATRNQKLATEMRKFVQYFGEQTEILAKE
ncbi:MAG: gliding motility protein GldC [Saprospiraceae bacterium]|nr:gliding motility protein GldC [Saprospiraceae bacterium]